MDARSAINDLPVGHQRFPFWLLGGLLTICLPASILAQHVTGNLQGRLVDSLGQAVSGADLIVSGTQVQGTRTGASDEAGAFVILALPTGRVELTIRHSGYQPLTIRDVLIELGRTTYLGDVKLQVRVHELPEFVVSGERPRADPTTTVTGANLRLSDFENLPLERDYRYIATLVPHANVSYLDDEVNFAGATGRENKYFIDGVDVTDPSFARAGTALPYNFIKEIQVISGGYEAEYASTLGGQINVITNSGSNEVHGSAFSFFTNNALSASRVGGLLDPTQGAFSTYDVGLGIGGPIIRDRLWIFAAYNPTFNRRDVELPGLGIYVDRSATHSFAAKLTWRASDRLNLIFVTSGDPSSRKAVGEIPPKTEYPIRLANPDPYLTDETKGGVNLSLDGSYIVADKILLNASLSRITRDETNQPSTELGRMSSALIDAETGVWSGGGFGHNFFFRSATTARTNAVFMAGSHSVKTGVEYREIRQVVDLDYPMILWRHSDSSFTFLGNGTHGSVNNRTFSAYVQDSWELSHHIRVHAGLRWEGQWIFGGGGQTVHILDGPLQPRVGIIWLPDEEGKQKVFASFGRFSQEWSSAVLTIYTGTQYGTYKTYAYDPRIGGFGDFPFDKIPDKTILRGQHYDEFAVGFEQMVGGKVQAGIHGTYRTLGEAINAGRVNDAFLMGNPGSGLLSSFPEARRDYAAIAVTLQSWGNDDLNFLLSYVLSRNYGNYEGVYDSYNKNVVPNVNWTYANPAGLRNATGLLPNDRTHSFKLAASYRFDFGLIVGTSFVWQTGTPLSQLAELGWYLQPRGSLGRTPNIWDLGARLTYLLPIASPWQTRLILDVSHIASRRDPVDFSQLKYYAIDGNGRPFAFNPTYGVAIRHQAPMSVRLGAEVSF